MLIQQGDVLFESIDRIPTGAQKRPLKLRNGRIVLIEGEVTGHAHTLTKKNGLHIWEDGTGTLYMDVPAPTKITHETHDAQTIPQGKFRIRQVRAKKYPLAISRAYDQEVAPIMRDVFTVED